MTTLTDSLLSLDEKAFAEIVDAETRGKVTNEVAYALRDPKVSHRWLEALEKAHASITGQLSANEAELQAKRAEGRLTPSQLSEAEARHARWKVGALRFKSGLEVTLVEARTAVRKSELKALDSRVRTLEEAVLNQPLPGAKGT